MSPRVSTPPKPRYSRSLEYGVAILESFTAQRPVLRISELADIVGISRSTTHRYASTLVKPDIWNRTASVGTGSPGTRQVQE
jgi:DNA-binding IclR family transcriptional regulator